MAADALVGRDVELQVIDDAIPSIGRDAQVLVPAW